MNSLTEQQFNTLVESIATTILNSNEEFGLGEMGDCLVIAKQTALKWAESNNINLPNL